MEKYWSSKPTLGVRFPPASMLWRLIYVNKTYFFNIISLSLIVLLFMVNDFFIGNNFGQRLVLASALGFALYWTTSIFVFLFKRSLYKSFTVVIQRYWKRTLYLFWLLEFYLFGIFVYLILVSPTEVEWLLDQPQLFTSKWWDGNIFFKRLLPTLVIILLVIECSFILLYGNMLVLYVVSLLITVLLISISYSDFTQIFLYSIYYSGASWDYDLDNNMWFLGNTIEKTRTISHYIFLLTLLKFWHTVFIVGVWLMTTMFLIQSPYIGQGSFAANKQNFFFLYGFAFLWILFLYKFFSNYSYESVYQWFFVNNWSIWLNNNVYVDTLKCLL
jgi:hypothetical protein